MADDQKTDLFCTHCKEPVAEEDTYCRNCGSIFSDGIFCTNHPSVEADGVCVICSKPFCKKCGEETLGVFLCDPHSVYEIQEGMARVYGNTDNVQAQFATSCLDEAGFHPFFFSRKFNPRADIVTLTNVRNFGRHPVSEMKVMVPFSEVLSAEKTLKEMGFIEE